jgi:phosphoglycolate phosphatase
MRYKAAIFDLDGTLVDSLVDLADAINYALEQLNQPQRPGPEKALQILKNLKVTPQQAIFTGDSSVDIKTAKACKVFAVGVSWGFRRADELVENGADIIIDRPAKLLDIFN